MTMPSTTSSANPFLVFSLIAGSCVRADPFRSAGAHANYGLRLVWVFMGEILGKSVS